MVFERNEHFAGIPPQTWVDLVNFKKMQKGGDRTFYLDKGIGVKRIYGYSWRCKGVLRPS